MERECYPAAGDGSSNVGSKGRKASTPSQTELNKRIKRLVREREDYPLIADVPYSGPNTLGVILAASGDVGRFSNYRKYVAYTGYFAGLRKSQTIDRTKMSNRGNRDLK